MRIRIDSSLNRGIEDLRFNNTGEYCESIPKSHLHLPDAELPKCAREVEHSEKHKNKINDCETMEWE